MTSDEEAAMVKAGQQSARRLAVAADKRERALALYLEGKTLAAIADAVGYSNRSSVHDAITTALAESADRRAELAKHALPEVLAKLDMLWSRHWAAGDTESDPRHGALCLQVVDRLIRLHGLDKIQIETTVTTRTELDAEIEELIARLNSKATPTPTREDTP